MGLPLLAVVGAADVVLRQCDFVGVCLRTWWGFCLALFGAVVGFSQL